MFFCLCRTFPEPSPLYDNNHYHEECLKCNSCGLNLTGPNQKRARRFKNQILCDLHFADVALMETSDFMQQLRAFKPQSLGCAVARRKSSTTLIFPLPPQACSGISEFRVLTEWVLPRGADLNVDRSTPLHIICKLIKSVEIDHVLLAKMFLLINGKLINPVRIDSQDRLGNAPLHLAILHSKRKLAELLLKSDADPNLANEEGLTPLHLVCRRHRHRYDDSEDQYVSLIESFFKIVDQKQKTLKLDARDKKGRTALQLAVASLLPTAVEALLKIGADVSDFVFPADFDEFLELFEPRISKNSLKFQAIVDAVAVVRRLNWKKYALKRSDALTMMRLFAECGLYELSTDLDGQPWYDDENVVALLKTVKIRNGRSFYDLVKLPLDEAYKQYVYRDYLLTRKLSKFLCLHWRVSCENLDARLGAILLRGLLRKFAAIVDHDAIVNNLTNEDFYHVCLVAAGESS
ncbi:hypothetical protein TKK_0005266 [Trichogramma kaykai]